MREDLKIEHESFGMLSICQQFSSRPVKMFGSAVDSSRYLVLRLTRCTYHRQLSDDSYHPDNFPLIEIRLTPTQLMEAIMFSNSSGIPVTIQAVNGKYTEEPPTINKHEQINLEFAKTLEKLDDKFADIINSLESFSGGKKSKEDLIQKVKVLRDHYNSNIPFVFNQFTKYVHKTMRYVKEEIANFSTYFKNPGSKIEAKMSSEIPLIESESIEVEEVK